MNDWKPEASDIEWTRAFLDRLNDGGVWGIPKNQSIWRINKTAMTMTCIHGAQDAMYHQLTAVCALLGYQTVYAPEGMSAPEVQKHMEATVLAQDVYGSGKYLSMTEKKPEKKYMFRPITPEDQAIYRTNLAKLPTRMRWKGRLLPQCDFCANEKPIVTYAATHLTTGEARECWRWLACAACHDAITRNDFKTVERRSASAFACSNPFAVKMALMAFHAHAIEV